MAVSERFKKFNFTKHKIQERNNEISTKTQIKFNPQTTSAIIETSKRIMLEIQSSLLEKIEGIPVWFEYSKSKQLELVENFFDNKIQNYPEFSCSQEEKNGLLQELFTSISGFGKIDYLLEQKNIDSVIINSHNVSVEISGKILTADIKLNDRQLAFLTKKIYHTGGVTSDCEKNIFHSVVDNCFVTVITPTVSQKGISIIIKKRPQKLGFTELLKNRMFPQEIADFLLTSIQARKNILIAGKQNCGKTFFVDNILTSVLNGFSTTIIEDYPQFSSDFEWFSKFSVEKIASLEEFAELINAIGQTMPEHFIADIKNPMFLSQVLNYVISTKGSVITLSSINAENAIAKAIGFLQNYGYSEKFAKTEILRNFDLVITLAKNNNGIVQIETITEISLAKTNAQCLKEIYNSEKDFTEEKVQTKTINNSSLKSRFTRV